MPKGKYILIVAGVVALAALFAWPKLNTPAGKYHGNLKCLVPNLPEAMHIHPRLTVLIDGQNEIMPANIGTQGDCHLPLHTHAADNVIHVESQVVRDYTLGEFLEVWDKPLQRDGYLLKMTVDGQPSMEGESLVLKDKQEVVLKYTNSKQ